MIPRLLTKEEIDEEIEIPGGAIVRCRGCGGPLIVPEMTKREIWFCFPCGKEQAVVNQWRHVN